MVACAGPNPHRPVMTIALQTIIQGVLERAPHWIRHDFASKDASVRQRAEETLAAMIANALEGDGRAGDHG